MVKATPKQRKFSRVYVETGNASEAYRQAYNVTNNNKSWVRTEASKVLATPTVAQTVIKLQERAAEKTLITVAKLTNRLDEIDRAAFADAQFSASNTAVMGQAKLNGLLVDKAELKHEGNMTFTTVYEAKPKKD